MKDSERENTSDSMDREDGPASEDHQSASSGGGEQDSQQAVTETTADQSITEKTPAEFAQQIEELRAQVNEYQDKHLRSVAEFSNYRKRQERLREQQTWRVKSRVIKRLLDPLDDFQRALRVLPDEYANSDWIKGILLIEQKLWSLLSEWQVEPIEAVGKPFDPNSHDALIREPSDEHPEGTVSEELKTGYMMENQVLRPAVVKVSSGPKEQHRARE